MLANREPHVLLIEDTPEDARLIGTLLADGNGGPFRLETVDRLSTALAVLESEPPDAILLDLGLPDSQGLDTLDRLRQQSGGTPIVVLTDFDDATTALPAIARGAQDCLPKGGFDEQLLVRTIRHAMERSLAEETAHASEELYRNLFEQANEAIVLMQKDVIRRINPRAVKILGYPEEEVAGALFTDFVHEEDRAIVAGRFARRMRGENPPANSEFRIRPNDGPLLWVDVTIGRIRWKGEPAVLAFLTDISERKAAEVRTAKLLERQVATNELTLALGATADPTRIYRILYEHVSHLVEAHYLGISTFDPERNEIRGRFAVVAEEERDAARLPLIPIDEEGKGLHSTVIRTGEPLLVGDYLEALQDDAVVYRVLDDGGVRRIESPDDMRGISARSAVLVPMKIEGEVVGTLQVQCERPNAFDREDVALLSGLANVAAIALQNSQLVQESRDQATQLRDAFDGIIQTVSTAAEVRDPYTAGHQQRVARLATAIAKEIGLDEKTAEGIRIASLVHDIGKLGIPSEILTKPGTLSDTEFEIIKTHAERAFHILQSIEFPWPIAAIVHQHHERLDGSGYPRGLRNADVLLEAQIVGVADVVEAMASHRPYRPALGIDRALQEIETHKGKCFNVQVAEACFLLFREKGFAFSEESDS
jgi:PAS domain S-box-containing protein/putative nucleotidyltransferase with HDIG domain